MVCIAGFLVKLSFVLVVSALIIDMLLAKWREINKSHLFYAGIVAAGFLVVAVATFAFFHLLNPAFDVMGMFEHALYYVQFSGRQYLQIAVQSMKAVFYLSPLLIVAVIFLKKEAILRARIFIVYLVLGALFYFVLFDFSRGALDKYLMYSIVPLSILNGLAFAKIFDQFRLKENMFHLVLGFFTFLGITALAYVTPEVVPLYPKTEWFSRVLVGEWGVLTPFNGGSGPVGFYVSFLVIGVSFIIAGAAALIGRIWKGAALLAGIIIISVGLAYNVVFIEEFSFGKLYGSAKSALIPAVEYIEGSSSINEVVTYNDIGAYELNQIGKYKARFYAAPQFEEVHKTGKFSQHDDAYLVVGIPPLYEGFYRDYFSSCTVLYTAQSGVIESTIYTACIGIQE
jgi:hypothetical protein